MLPLPFRRQTLSILVFLLGFWMVSFSQASTTKIVLPLTLDYELLTSLLISSGYVGEDLTALVTGTQRDCTYIRISAPHYSTTKNGLIRLRLKLFVKLGTPFQDQCFVPAEWQGYVDLLQQPVFDGEKFTLSFKTLTSTLYDLHGQPAKIAGFLWQFAQPKVFAYLDNVIFELAPPIAEMQRFLGPLFHTEIRQTMQKTLNTIKGGEAIVYSSGLVLELLAEVREAQTQVGERVDYQLTAKERQEAIKLWETWDAFLVQLLTTMAAQPLAPQDRTVLFDVLLGIRHGFTELLHRNDLQKDLVRSQFITAWQKLGTIFRKQLYSKPSDNILGYFAFFTAADALSVFDRMGPSFGLEMSEQGLLRLLRMLKGNGSSLQYSPIQDKKLREMMQLPEINWNKMELPPAEGIAVPNEGPLGFFSDFMIQPLYAASKKPIPSFKEILRWKVTRANCVQHIQRVRSVLQVASERVLSRKNIPRPLHNFYNELIPAMAWQESCFRQFVVKKKKFTYLLSYNRSSVGLMQINERVWRGFYDRNRLRWDIHYNALAGCEIVDLYLRRYVLQDKKWSMSSQRNLLAQLLYAMYNGGPGQYKKFQARARTGKIYQSDQLFLEKYQWAKKGEWNRVKICLVGG